MPVYKYAFFSAGDAILVPLMVGPSRRDILLLSDHHLNLRVILRWYTLVLHSWCRGYGIAPLKATVKTRRRRRNPTHQPLLRLPHCVMILKMTRRPL